VRVDEKEGAVLLTLLYGDRRLAVTLVR
jgi:hypothetical protein